MHQNGTVLIQKWIPACAGMTVLGLRRSLCNCSILRTAGEMEKSTPRQHARD